MLYVFIFHFPVHRLKIFHRRLHAYVSMCAAHICRHHCDYISFKHVCFFYIFFWFGAMKRLISHFGISENLFAPLWYWPLLLWHVMCGKCECVCVCILAEANTFSFFMTKVCSTTIYNNNICMWSLLLKHIKIFCLDNKKKCRNY